MKTSVIVALITSCILASCAQIPSAETAARKSAEVDYNALAGESVNTVFFSSLSGWQAVDATATGYGPTQLIVHTGVSKAYLLTLYAPCRDLDFSVQIAVTSAGHQLSAGFDKILIPHHESCRIKTIQPIDFKAMRAAEKAARLAKRAK